MDNSHKIPMCVLNIRLRPFLHPIRYFSEAIFNWNSMLNISSKNSASSVRKQTEDSQTQTLR